MIKVYNPDLSCGLENVRCVMQMCIKATRHCVLVAVVAQSGAWERGTQFNHHDLGQFKQISCIYWDTKDLDVRVKLRNVKTFVVSSDKHTKVTV